MSIFSLRELFDLIVMWVAITWIFLPNGLKKEDIIKFAAFVGGGVVFHELFHKFSAILLNVPAEFHTFYLGLILGIIMKFIFPFIVIIPGYVSIAPTTPFNELIIAFSGPLANLIFWLVLKEYSIRKNDYLAYLGSEVNKFLFIFNMIPIPPLDGFKVFINLISILF